MKQKLSVSIIIPNWNGIDLLKKHLPVVIKNSGNAKIIIMDDNSTDQSVSYIHTHFPDVSVIRKQVHEGFSSTVNKGVKEAKSDIVVLLNTDIEPEKGYLEPLLSRFSDNHVFAVGCLDKSMEHGNIVLRGRGIGWWEKGFYIHKRGDVGKSDTAWVSGGSGAFRRSMWNILGGMDELFNPFYWEDIDLSYRAVKNGYRILFEPKSIVCHYHEEGMIKSQYTPSQIQQIAYRNQFLFIWKNFGSAENLLAHIFFTPVRLFQAIIRSDWAMIRGYVQAVSKIPKLLLH